MIKKPLTEVSSDDAIRIAEILFPGNDRCTVIESNNIGGFLMDIDSSSSTEFSLRVVFDFPKSFNKQYGSHIISGFGMREGVPLISSVLACIYLLDNGYDVPTIQK